MSPITGEANVCCIPACCLQAEAQNQDHKEVWQGWSDFDAIEHELSEWEMGEKLRKS